MRDGVHPSYPAQVYDKKQTNHSLTLFAPTKRIWNRGSTLDGPLLTIRLSSPHEDIIRVRIEHFSGENTTNPLAENPELDTITVTETEELIAFQSGQLIAQINKKEWRLDFLGEGVPITSSADKGAAFITTDSDGSFMLEQLSLGVGECVYGLGERFTAFVKNGQVVDIWNKDGGASSEQSYKNIPFYITNRGYGVHVRDTGAVSFEVGSEKASRVLFSVPGQVLEYDIIYGPTPKEILEKYTAVYGRPALPPAWSFGLWLTTSFTTDYDEKTVTGMLDEMAKRDLPLHVFHFDCFWMRPMRWCDFEWDPETFPHPAEMLARLKQRGLKICVWINPYIAQLSSLFDEGVKGGYFLKKPNGDIRQTDDWQAGMAIVDFTNPYARKWYADKLRALLRDGVDCFKTDFGERIPTDVVYFDGSDPVRMHNHYSYLYNKTVFDLLKEERGEGDAVLFARSASTGGHQFPVHWGGDCHSSFESMAESLRGGLSLSLCGYGFWSHDIGGFEGSPRADIYKRWIGFGLLSSHSRLHGSSSYRVPWLFDEEAVDVLRHFTKLKCSLMPYIFGKAVEAHTSGIPTMRAMLLEFPDDPAVDHLDRQYMLGDSLLVAPVLRADNIAEYYLPEGRWTRFTTGEVVDGGRWIRETHGFESIPLLVRQNSIIAVGASDSEASYDYASGAQIRIYQLGDGFSTSALIPDTTGKTVLSIQAKRTGSSIAISLSGRADHPSILLAGINEAKVISGGSSISTPHGTLITPTASEILVNLRSAE